MLFGCWYCLWAKLRIVKKGDNRRLLHNFRIYDSSVVSRHTVWVNWAYRRHTGVYLDFAKSAVSTSMTRSSVSSQPGSIVFASLRGWDHPSIIKHTRMLIDFEECRL